MLMYAKQGFESPDIKPPSDSSHEEDLDLTEYSNNCGAWIWTDEKGQENVTPDDQIRRNADFIDMDEDDRIREFCLAQSALAYGSFS